MLVADFEDVRSSVGKCAAKGAIAARLVIDIANLIVKFTLYINFSRTQSLY